MMAVLIVLVSVIRAVGWLPVEPCRWNETTLSFGYQYGFIQRGFLGTVIYFVSQVSHAPNTTIINIFQFFTVFTMVVVSLVILFWSISKMQKTKESKYFVYTFASMVFVLGIGWDTWFSYNLFAHTDVWLILLTIFSSFCILKKKYIPSLLLVVICLLIHQAYVFMYLNVLICAFLLLALKEKSNKPLKWLGIMLLLCSALFVYLQFFSKAKSGITYEIVRENAISYSGQPYIDIWESQTKTYLFREADTQSATQGWQLFRNYFYMELFFAIPFLVEFIKYWHRIIKATDDKLRRTAYIIAPWGVLTAVPLFAMHTDFGRWMFAVYFYEIALICLVNSIDDANVSKVNVETIEYIKKNLFYYCAFSAYIVLLGGMDRSYIRHFYGSVFNIGSILFDN